MGRQHRTAVYRDQVISCLRFRTTFERYDYSTATRQFQISWHSLPTKVRYDKFPPSQELICLCRLISISRYSSIFCLSNNSNWALSIGLDTGEHKLSPVPSIQRILFPSAAISVLHLKSVSRQGFLLYFDYSINRSRRKFQIVDVILEKKKTWLVYFLQVWLSTMPFYITMNWEGNHRRQRFHCYPCSQHLTRAWALCCYKCKVSGESCGDPESARRNHKGEARFCHCWRPGCGECLWWSHQVWPAVRCCYPYFIPIPLQCFGCEERSPWSRHHWHYRYT